LIKLKNNLIHKMLKNSFLLVFLSLCSCGYFKPEQELEAVARVGKNFLYKSDITSLVPGGTSKEDSLLLVRDYIDRWATQELLIDAAQRNLNETKKAEYTTLIKQYEIDLYTKAYIEEVVKKTVDTTFTSEELKVYYDENKENFRTNESLVRLRFINIAKNTPRLETIKSKFFNYSSNDKSFWKNFKVQCKSYAIDDAMWIGVNQVYAKLPFITPENKDNFLVAGKKIEKSEKNDVYLIKITSVIDKNQITPFDYCKPILKEVLLNKRKLDLIKKFEKDITNDAIKNNNYEIYK